MAVTQPTYENDNNIRATLAGNIVDVARALAPLVAAPWQAVGAVPVSGAQTQTQGISVNDTVHNTTRYVLVTVTAQETDSSYVAGQAITC